MTLEQLKAQASELISKAKLKAALKIIKTWAHQNNAETLKNKVALFSKQVHQLEEQENMGLISKSEAFIQSNQITNGILSLLDNKSDASNTHSLTSHSTSKQRRTLKIFLASSNELKADRDAFELHFGARKRKTFFHDIEVVLWEDFIDAMSKTRLQDEYNKAVRACDIFVMLFFTKVGKFTAEEFETAFGHFQTNGRPLIYTYFKNAPIKTGEMSEKEMLSLFAFKNKLRELEHFASEYQDAKDLNFQFSNQLDKLLKHNQI